MHEHSSGCGHLPEEELHHHDHAEHIGQMCMAGQCHHPEHLFLQEQLLDQLNAELPPESTTENLLKKKKAKKKKKVQPLLAALFAKAA